MVKPEDPQQQQFPQQQQYADSINPNRPTYAGPYSGPPHPGPYSIPYPTTTYSNSGPAPFEPFQAHQGGQGSESKTTFGSPFTPQIRQQPQQSQLRGQEFSRFDLPDLGRPQNSGLAQRYSPQYAPPQNPEFMRQQVSQFDQARQPFTPHQGFTHQLAPQLTPQLAPQLTPQLTPQFTTQINPQINSQFAPQLSHQPFQHARQPQSMFGPNNFQQPNPLSGELSSQNASQLPPEAAMIHLRQTVEFMLSKEHHETAIAIARSCSSLLPQNLEVMDMLASTLYKTRRYDEALPLALEITSKISWDHGARFNASKCLYRVGRVADAEAMIREGLRLSPSFIDGKLDLALYLSAQGKNDEAFSLLKELENLMPGDPRVIFNLGWYALRHGDFKDGMRRLGVGREIAVWGSRTLRMPRPMWNGEDPQGQTLLIVSEGGIGDEMISARFAKHLRDRGAKVILACSEKLISLMSRMDGPHRVIRHQEMYTTFFNYWVPGMDAARLCNIDYETIPNDTYLSSNPTYVEKWKAIIEDSSELRIGIRWQGNPEFEYDQLRTVPAHLLFRLADQPNVKVFSLQRDEGAEAIEGETRVKDLSRQLVTWEDTAAAIERIDLLITSCTAIAHLAAAMGKPTWIIIPTMPYYLWAYAGPKSHWYKTVTLFRQTKYDSWNEPCDEVLEHLKKYLAARSLE